MKRTFDFVSALLGGVLALPVIALCSILIRATSPGPAIFRQVRVGRHGSEFVCLKLRTMSVGTSDAPSHEISASAVTPIGRWLRRVKIDELPQLWNIVRGEMSLVGPRPCLPQQHKLIAARRARGLLELRPGVTGVSQVAGIDMSDPERLARSDETYLARMTLMDDIRIILMTITGAGRGDAVGQES